jgi:hypothetical protein
MTRLAIAAATALALFLAAPPAQAQTSAEGQHGVTGPVTTTSDIAGGAFSPERRRDTVTPVIQAAVERAAWRIRTRLASGALTDAAGRPVPVAPQITVLQAFQGDTLALAAVVDALGAPEAHGLRVSLDGLLNGLSLAQLARAAADFNRLVETADPGILANPPAEFLVVHAVLHSLASAAIAASR